MEERQLARVALKKTLLELDGSLDWVEDWSFDQLLSVLIRFSKALSQDPLIRPADLKDLENLKRERQENWRRRMKELARDIRSAAGSEKAWIAFAAEIESLGSLENLPSRPRTNARAEMPVDAQESAGQRWTKIRDEITEFFEF